MYKRQVIYSLIKRLSEKDINIFISELKDEFGKIVQWINFVSVTEQFEKKGIAQKKVKKFLSEELVKSTTKIESGFDKLGKDLKSDKASDQFIASLTSTFGKRQQHKIERKEKLKELKNFPFKAKQITVEMKEIVIDIIKKEYKMRIQEVSKYPNFYIPISEIGEKIRLKTKIPLGFLYLLLDHISKEDLELKLLDNPENEKNKTIRFVPSYDNKLFKMLVEFRPIEYQELKTLFMVNFLISFKKHDPKKIFKNLYKKIDKKSEWRKRFRFLKEKYETNLVEKKKIFTLEELAEVFATVRKIKKQKILLSRIPKSKIEIVNDIKVDDNKILDDPEKSD